MTALRSAALEMERTDGRLDEIIDGLFYGVGPKMMIGRWAQMLKLLKTSVQKKKKTH